MVVAMKRTASFPLLLEHNLYRLFFNGLQHYFFPPHSPEHTFLTSVLRHLEGVGYGLNQIHTVWVHLLPDAHKRIVSTLSDIVTLMLSWVTTQHEVILAGTAPGPSVNLTLKSKGLSVTRCSGKICFFAVTCNAVFKVASITFVVKYSRSVQSIGILSDICLVFI